MSVNKFRLIEEVRKRPLLWDCQNLPFERNKIKRAAQWAEVAQILNVDENECKHTWKSLRANFRNEARIIPKRIAKAKKIQKYSPHDKYCRWIYFDALKFLAIGITDKAPFHKSFTYVNKRMEEIEKDQLCNSSTFQTGSAVKLLECNNLTQMQTTTSKYVEAHDDIDSDIEIILEEDLDETECHKDNYLKNKLLPKESENRSSINSSGVYNEITSEDKHFQTYNVSMSSFIPHSEYTTICNNNADPQSYPAIKIEPELQLKTEKYPLENKSIGEDVSTVLAHEAKSCLVEPDLLMPLNENEHEELEEFISNTPASNNIKVEHPASTAFPEEQISSAPDLNDEDYSFLYSFLSQTKIMTQLQKRELHVKMKNLLLNIFPASASVKILEKQLLLPEDNDPDKKFLTSFWPFIKTMSCRQNLQFRVKMIELVLKILSSKTI